MSGMLLTKRTLGFKIEGTPYTAETLTNANYNLNAYDISYDPDIQMTARKLAKGDFSRDPSISGKRAITISFSVDMNRGSAANVAPSYFGCLQACGLKQTAYTTTGIALTPNADYSNVPATIEVVERDEGASAVQVVIKAHGCMGNAKLITNNIGEPKKIEFEFKGVLNSITDRPFASLLTPTGFDTILPEAVLLCTTSLFTEAQYFNKVTLDLGNKVELWVDPNKAQGYEGARIVDREATLEIDPSLALIATNGHFVRETSNTRGAYSETIGSNLKITALQAQIVSAYKPGEREGRVVNNIKCILVRDTNGNDEFEILQGAKA